MQGKGLVSVAYQFHFAGIHLFVVIIKNVIKAAANRAHINHSFTDGCNSKVATLLLLLERCFYPWKDVSYTRRTSCHGYFSADSQENIRKQISS